jgi:hypothetical protein
MFLASTGSEIQSTLLPEWNQQENVINTLGSQLPFVRNRVFCLAAMKIQITDATEKLLTSLGGFHMTERGAVSVKVKECFSHR